MAYCLSIYMTKCYNNSGDNVMTLIETRKEFGLSQQAAANIARMPLRSYVRYEGDNEYGSVLKREAIIKAIIAECEITEDKGVLSLNQIIKGVNNVITSKYRSSVSLCYLFGSYAKGYATETSDVDLCVSTKLTGLKYIGLIETLRQELHKKIDLINLKNADHDLIYEIMKDGIKIYG